MSSSLRRGTLAATALALSVATLTACAAGNDAQTLEIKPDNAATRVGTIKVQNANIVTDAQGSGQATVAVRIFNDGKKAQTLKGVAIKGQRAKLSPAKGERKLEIPAGGSLALGGKKNAAARVRGRRVDGRHGRQRAAAHLRPQQHRLREAARAGGPGQARLRERGSDRRAEPEPRRERQPSGSPSPSSSKGEKGRDQQGGRRGQGQRPGRGRAGANRQDDATGSPKATSGSSEQGARTGH